MIRCAGHNTELSSKSNILKTVTVNIAFMRTFFKEYLISFLMIFRLTGFALARSSRPEVFCKIGVLRNFAKFTGKHLRLDLQLY